MGPLIAAVVVVLLPESELLPRSASMAAGLGILMATWWATECIPIPVTSLLPLTLFPVTGVLDLTTTASGYGHPLIFLFLGGFILALGLEKTGLHRRIALSIIAAFSTRLEFLLGGFMLASALLSMWVTNTATTMMMLPIGISVFSIIADRNQSAPEAQVKNFGRALMLGIAYSSTIGGLATLVGTVPNSLFAAFAQQELGITVDFFTWMKFGLPLSVLMTPISWWVLIKVFPFDELRLTDDKSILHSQIRSLGRMTRDETLVAVIVGLTSAAWIFRPLLNRHWQLNLSDTSIAIGAAIVLFIAPSRDRSGAILDWDTAKRLPWDVLLLFGGGLALAAAIKDTGLSLWLGESLKIFAGVNLFVLMLIVSIFLVSLTELTSNTATTATFLPIIAALAEATNNPPLYLLLPVTICASCAFMLPVATPPNAIVFGSGKVMIRDMVKAGFWLNVLSAVIVCTVSYLMISIIFTP